MMVDVGQVRGVVSTSFGYRDEVRDDGSKIAFDTAAAFFRDLQRSGLRYAEMAPDFARAYHHYGSMSWQRTTDRQMPASRRLKQLAKQARVVVKLRRARVRTRTQHAE